MRIRLLDVEFDALTVNDLHAEISEAVTARERKIIANHNLHSIYLSHTDPQMRKFFCMVDKVHIDGMPLVYLARFFGYKVQRQHRVTYVDWVRPLMSVCAQQGWKVFYLGGRPGVAGFAAQRLQKVYPSLKIETHHGYFTKTNYENLRVLEIIHSFNPHILMVGMGMPLQERWIAENLNQINATVILTAGACFDYIAETLPTPPRWMGQIGLEWLYRLISEPKRLWKRYLLEPWYILGLVVKEFIHPKS
ncbi:MAG TPA: WecB/TagA/CpsF family glycosyltransferase [Anaerolineales bacterium]|nr:WecB/TagA/CpsF family glycosyltransferase [Anaerolineales bacterium]